MTLETTTNSAIESLTANQLIHWQSGDAWESGCEVTLANSTDDIVISVTQGSVYVGGTQTTVNAQQKILQTGDNQNPRKDLVVVDANGSVDVIAGTPASIKSDLSEADSRFDPVYHAYRPAADELDGKDGQLVPLAVVWVPPDATASSDLDENITYVMDRRLKNPANAITPTMINALEDADDSVQANNLADGAVGTTATLADSVVTSAKVATDAIGASELDETGDYTTNTLTTGTLTPDNIDQVRVVKDGDDFAAMLSADGTTPTVYYFTGGTFTGEFEIPDNTAIIGDRHSVTFQSANLSGTLAEKRVLRNVDTAVGNSNIHIEGVRINGTLFLAALNSGAFCDNITIRDVDVADVDDRCIDLRSPREFTIDNCRVGLGTQISGAGYQLIDCQRGTLRNLYGDVADDLIAIGAEGTAAPKGIDISGVHGSSEFAGALKLYHSDVQQTVPDDHHIENISARGFDISTCGGGLYLDTDSTTAAEFRDISASDWNIDAATTDGSGQGTGIQHGAGENPARNAVVSNFTVSNTAAEYAVLGGGDWTLNEFSGSGMTATTTAGVLSNADKLRVNGGSLEDFTQHGIVSRGDGDIIRDVIIDAAAGNRTIFADGVSCFFEYLDERNGTNDFASGTILVKNGVTFEDLGTSPSSEPTLDVPAGTTVRNLNADNNEAWQLMGSSWVQIA